MDRALHEFSKWLVPDEGEQRSARAVENLICRTLQRHFKRGHSSFTVDRMRVLGSTGRGTAISLGADEDAYVFVRPARPTARTASFSSSSTSDSTGSTAASTSASTCSSSETLVLPSSASSESTLSTGSSVGLSPKHSEAAASTSAAAKETACQDLPSENDSTAERTASECSGDGDGEPREKERRTNLKSLPSRRRREKRYKKPAAADEAPGCGGGEGDKDAEAETDADAPENAIAAAGETAAFAPANRPEPEDRATGRDTYVPTKLPEFNDLSMEILKVLSEAPELLELGAHFQLSNVKLSEGTFKFVQGRVGGREFDLMPSVCLSQHIHEQCRRVLDTLKADDPLFITSLIEFKVEFVKEQSAFAHELVRIAKFWNRSLFIEHFMSGRSVLIERLAIWAAIEELKSRESEQVVPQHKGAAARAEAKRRAGHKGRKRQSLASAFRRFLNFFKNPERDQLIVFDPFKPEVLGFGARADGDLRGGLVQRERWAERPLVLDATPPYENLAEGLVGKSDTAHALRKAFREMACTTLERLNGLVSLLQDPCVKPLTDREIISQLFAPQPELSNRSIGLVMQPSFEARTNLMGQQVQLQANIPVSTTGPPLTPFATGAPIMNAGLQAAEGFVGQTSAHAYYLQGGLGAQNQSQTGYQQAICNSAFPFGSIGPVPTAMDTLTASPQILVVPRQTPAGLLFETIVVSAPSMLIPNATQIPPFLATTYPYPSPQIIYPSQLQPFQQVPTLYDPSTGLTCYAPPPAGHSAAFFPNSIPVNNSPYVTQFAADQLAGPAIAAPATWPAHPASQVAGPFTPPLPSPLSSRTLPPNNYPFGMLTASSANYPQPQAASVYEYSQPAIIHGAVPIAEPQSTLQAQATYYYQPQPNNVPNSQPAAPLQAGPATHMNSTPSGAEEARSAIAKFIPTRVSVSLREIPKAEALRSAPAADSATSASQSQTGSSDGQRQEVVAGRGYGWTEETGVRVRKKMLQPLLVYCAHNARVLLAAAAVYGDASAERERLGTLIVDEIKRVFPTSAVQIMATQNEQVLREQLLVGPVRSNSANTSLEKSTTTTPGDITMATSRTQALEAIVRFPVGFPIPKWEVSLVAQWARDFEIEPSRVISTAEYSV